MKTILLTFVLSFGISAHAQSTSGRALPGSTNGAFIFTTIPLTNQPAFTNTLVPPTNGAAFQLPDLVKMLLTLQTNIETALPVLDFVQTNASVVSVIPTNTVQGFFSPMTSIPPPLGLTPTGASSGTNRPHVTSISVSIGTNSFDIDAATLQGIFILRNRLQQTLPVLQSLNGTSPNAGNSTNSPPSFFNPDVTNLMPNPITNQFAAPLTNIAPF